MATVTKSPTRESLPHPSEQSQPRHRNVYDYDGEYEFPTVQHWTAPVIRNTVRVTSAITRRCPLYPQKQTLELDRGISALCHFETHA